MTNLKTISGKALQELSETELQSVIENAEKALREKQTFKRKEVITQIKELAASIGVSVEILESEKKSVRKGAKVAAKYRNPNEPEKTWTGRGMMPKWLKEFLDAGRDRSEFEI
ncbi:MAG: H-NS histone family protein [Methylococcales bacterium]|nr:H-NS histone family protein [Methylococcaceae bacterium]